MKVYYNGNFWGQEKYECAGKEIPIRKNFRWGEEKGEILSVYCCKKGLVLDFCFEIPIYKIEQFLLKWNMERRSSELSNEEYEQMEWDSPFQIGYSIEAQVNGKRIEQCSLCAAGWHPCHLERENIEEISEKLMEYYKRSRENGWQFIRAFIPWQEPEKTKPDSLSINFVPHQVSIPGGHFMTKSECKSEDLTFRHPLTGAEYRLQVLECEQGTLDANVFGQDKELEYPLQYQIIYYQVTPELSEEEFRIMDCASGDQPRKRTGNGGKTAAAACSVLFAGKRKRRGHSVCSALHFDEVKEVEWRMVFYQKEKENLELAVI